MSENKEENNSSAADVKEEEKSLKTEENKTIDDSSKDSDKDSAKEDSVKEESEKGSEKDESEDDEDDEEEMGLLDRPVEVSGCRARKQVERLELSFTTPKEKQHDIPAGKGDKLGDCPRIEHQIQKTSINELKPLHRILFSRVGSGPEIKKNIRKFSGFTFSKSSQEYDRKKAQIEKFTNTVLKRICEVLDIERGGTKEDIVNRLLDFLLEPKDSGKKIPKKKQSAKEKKKTTEKKTNNKKAKAKKEVSSDEEPDSANESASEESSDEDDSDNDSQKKSKNASKAKKTPSKTVAKKPEKKEKPKKEEKKAAKGAKRKRDADSDSSEEEPSAKKTKMPTDDDIKKLVKRILDSADLQEITMKKVIKQVSDAYPDSDLSHKKAFIKSTIKSVIS